MHPEAKMSRLLLTAVLSVALAQLAGCGSPETVAEPTGAASSETTAPASGQPSDSAEASPEAEAPLDYEALSERDAPDRVLRFYAAALHQKQWSAAALAWDTDSGVSAELLKSAYDRPVAPTLAIGAGSSEGAAGSLFYEAPIVLNFGDGSDALRGTVTLRRSNDVPGASEEQLTWRIRSSTIGPNK